MGGEWRWGVGEWEVSGGGGCVGGWVSGGWRWVTCTLC